jgi:hypothetical protein
MLMLQKGKAIGNKDLGSINKSWLVSEKYDGERAWWDGGVSRGVINVPWRHKGKRLDRDAEGNVLPCTGLWSMNGNPIYAPDWWLDGLPVGVILDGELWGGYGQFQTVHSTVSRLPQNGRMDAEGPWGDIRFQVFDAPTCEDVFQTRAVVTPTCNIRINRDDCLDTFVEHGYEWTKGHRSHWDALMMLSTVPRGRFMVNLWEPVRNVRVGETDVDGWATMVKERGGEGLIIRDPTRPWVPNRVGWVIKVKPRFDAEGVVLGYVSGKGKHTGRMGSVIVRSAEGAIFQLSGFTDHERAVQPCNITEDETVYADMAIKWFEGHQGSDMPDWITCPNIPGRGEEISYSYRELSRPSIGAPYGVPKEAAYRRR